MRISDWSSDVCSSDLIADNATALGFNALAAGDSSTAAGGELHYTYYDAELMEDVTIEGTTAATGIGAAAYGAGAQATGDLTTALGATAGASGMWATGLGSRANVAGESAVAGGDTIGLAACRERVGRYG